MAQLVATPPRAADTNEPVTIVGAGAGSSGGCGASGIPVPVMITGVATGGRPGSKRSIA